MYLSAQHYDRLARLLRNSKLRYLMVGGMLFLLDFAVTRLLYVQLHQPLEIAQWVGRLTGAAVGHWAHRLFTFQSTTAPLQKTHIRFWLVATVLWLVSPYVLKEMVTFFPASFLMAKLLTECILVCASYTLLRFFVFRSAGEAPKANEPIP